MTRLTFTACPQAILQLQCNEVFCATSAEIYILGISDDRYLFVQFLSHISAVAYNSLIDGELFLTPSLPRVTLVNRFYSV